MTGKEEIWVRSLPKRILRAAKLDTGLYEEVEKDESAWFQSLSVVVLSSLAAALGDMFPAGAGGVFWYVLTGLLNWLIWAAVIYLIGVKVFPEAQTRSNMRELLRTLGFAHAPGMIYIFGIIPGIRNILFFAVSLWIFLAMITAVKQALDYRGTGRAAGVCFAGWIFQIAALWIFSLFF